MPVRFNGCAPERTFPILQFKLGHPHFVLAGSDPSFRLETPLHYLPGQNRTVPCLHEDCASHHLPVRYCTYCPCMWWDHESRRYQLGVLPVNFHNYGFLKLDAASSAIFCFERRRYFNAPISFWEKERWTGQPFEGFDCTPSLLRMWGQHCHFKGGAKLKLVGPDLDRLDEEREEEQGRGKIA